MRSSNRFISSVFSTGTRIANAKTYAVAQQNGHYAIVSNGGTLMDGFYRNTAERTKPGDRLKHLGLDITGQVAANGDWDDPRRGQTVYAAIKPTIPLTDIRVARAYDKKAGQNYTIPINGSGDATMQEVKIRKQPWAPIDDDSYGGIVGLHCVYNYNNDAETLSQFTLYLEFLHLITESYLPKNSSGHIATLDYWNSLQRGIGFGPTIEANNNQIVPASTFAGPNYPVVGYLGATQKPHVHVQVAYFSGRNFSMITNIRVDPNIMIL